MRTKPRGGTVNLRPWDADVVRAPPNNPYHGHRFPGEIISQVVWLYFRLSVSYRDVEEMMAMRGVQLTYETVREWCGKFGSYFAEELRRLKDSAPSLSKRAYVVFIKLKTLCR
jgi:transposase-like protein